MKLISAIALLGSAHHVFAEDYNPSGRFELKHGDPDKMAITGTAPALEGEVYFTSSDDERFSYTVEYYDMSAAGENPTTCLSGTFVNVDDAPTNAVGGTGLLDHVSVFNLPASIWNENTAIICARMESNVNGEEIDAIETLATVTRTFTGEFSISIATKTKDAAGFTSADNDNTIAVEPYLCDDSENRITNQSVEFAQGQDFKICVAYDAISAPADDNNNYNINALRNVNCAWENPNLGKMIYDGDGLCMYSDQYDDVYQSSDCNGPNVFSLEFDDSDRLVRVGNGDCLMNDDTWLKFRPCTDDDKQKFEYRDGFLINVVAGVEKCGHIAAETEIRLRMIDDCTAVTDTFTIDFSQSETLVDATGAAQGLTDLSAPGFVMSFTGVVKSAYVANGNTELSCSGDVDLNVASRRLETTNHNVRFSTRARALNTRAVQTTRGLEEVETEFSVGIKLDPTASTSAAASTGMTSMVLMAAAGVLVALI